jgi:hypothetical protein
MCPALGETWRRHGDLSSVGTPAGRFDSALILAADPDLAGHNLGTGQPYLLTGERGGLMASIELHHHAVLTMLYSRCCTHNVVPTMRAARGPSPTRPPRSRDADIPPSEDPLCSSPVLPCVLFSAQCRDQQAPRLVPERGMAFEGVAVFAATFCVPQTALPLLFSRGAELHHTSSRKI